MRKINSSIRYILDTADLTPRPAVNDAFSYLVENRHNINFDELSSGEVSGMQKASSTAEYLLEKYWAEKIIQKQAAVDNFIYLDYYKLLVEKEVEALESVTGGKFKTVSFVGGGPLPLTSILMARDYGIKSKVFDVDQDACRLAAKVIEMEGISSLIQVVNKSGEDVELDSGVVFVAALAETKEGKLDLFETIHSKVKDGTTLAIRGSEGSSILFYKPIPDDFILKYKEVARVLGDQFINTTHIFIK